MKKLFTLLLALVATTALWAHDFEVDGIFYKILTDNEVEVTYAGSYEDSYIYEYSGSVTIPETVTYNGTTYSVTSIGYSAFQYCSGLTSVTIPNSVTSIVSYAFSGCSGLTSVTIPNSVTSIGSSAFKGCSGLTSVTIPNSVTSIGYSAFQYCSGLTSVTIPNSVTSIGNQAFRNCSSLTSVVWNAKNCADFSSDSAPFYDVRSQITSFTFDDSVQHIPAYMCYGMNDLTSVTIPNSVKSIGSEAFAGCVRLTSVVWNAKNCANFSSDSAPFYDVRSQITSFTFGDSVQHIPAYMCYGMNDLTSVTIPNSVTSIGSSAFKGCFGLTSITIPNSVTSIGSYAFKGCSLKSIIIPENITNIGTGVFVSCASLTSVVWNAKNCVDFFTGSFSEMGTFSTLFFEWSSTPSYNGPIVSTTVCPITSVVFGDEVESIPANLCYGLERLTFITLPNSVTSIGDEAFYGCDSLTSITCEATTPPTLGSNIFYGVSTSIPVYVPCGSEDTYKSADGWNLFSDIQEPLADYTINVFAQDTQKGSATVDFNRCDGNQISATANYGYHFVQWSDGNTDNPRTLVLTQDTILTAEFALTLSGQCGDDLYWAYDEANKTISITGSGDMYDYTKSTQPWLLFQEQITEVTTSNTTTSIGTSAFEGCVRLGKVSLGYGMGNIAANAFAECKRLYDIYVFASYPPFAEESSFANYNVYLYVPCENQRDYILDVVWGNFKFIECIGAESDETGGDDVTVTPGTNDVTITWPTEDGADTYSIVITKDGEVFCTLTFNSNGQLVSIAFAPGREGNHPAQYAEATANGYRFTVTGLDESTKYAYNLDVNDNSGKTIKSYEGEFTTNSVTGVEDVVIRDGTTQKLLRDGQLLIIRHGKTYNAQGVEL